MVFFRGKDKEKQRGRSTRGENRRRGRDGGTGGSFIWFEEEVCHRLVGASDGVAKNSFAIC